MHTQGAWLVDRCPEPYGRVRGEWYVWTSAVRIEEAAQKCRGICRQGKCRLHAAGRRERNRSYTVKVEIEPQWRPSLGFDEQVVENIQSKQLLGQPTAGDNSQQFPLHSLPVSASASARVNEVAAAKRNSCCALAHRDFAKLTFCEQEFLSRCVTSGFRHTCTDLETRLPLPSGCGMSQPVSWVRLPLSASDNQLPLNLGTLNIDAETTVMEIRLRVDVTEIALNWPLERLIGYTLTDYMIWSSAHRG